MLFVFLILCPVIGLLLLTAARLWEGIGAVGGAVTTDERLRASGQRRFVWRRRGTWAAVAIAAVLAAVAVAIVLVDDLQAFGPFSATVPLPVALVTTLNTAVAGYGVVQTIRALAAESRRTAAAHEVAAPRDGGAGATQGGLMMATLPSLTIETGWLLLVSPLLYVAGALAIVILPVVLLRLGQVQRERRREERLLHALATSVAGRTPLPQAIRRLAGPARASNSESEDVAKRRLGRRNWRRRLRELAAALETGASLADGLTRADLLTPQTINVIRASEGGPTLPITLASLAAEQRTLVEAIRERPRGAMLLYLWVLLLASAALVTLLAERVFPQLVTLYIGFGVELPRLAKDWLTEFEGGVLASPTFLTLFAVTGVAVVLLMVAQTGPGRFPVSLLHRLPARLSGGAIMRALAEPVLAARPVEPTVAALQRAAETPYWQARWGGVESGLASGRTVAETLAREGLIDVDEQRTIQSAERIGATGPALRELSIAREHRSYRRAQLFGDFLRAAVYVSLAAVVANAAVVCLIMLCKLINSLS